MVLHIQYHAAMAGRQVATRARITPTNRKTTTRPTQATVAQPKLQPQLDFSQLPLC